MIELKGDFVFTEALFEKDNIPKYEDMGLNRPENELEDMEPWPFRFRLSSLNSYNPSGEKGITTARLEGKDYYRINVPFEEFDEFITKNIKYT